MTLVISRKTHRLVGEGQLLLVDPVLSMQPIK